MVTLHRVETGGTATPLLLGSVLPDGTVDFGIPTTSRGRVHSVRIFAFDRPVRGRIHEVTFIGEETTPWPMVRGRVHEVTALGIPA
jgi:hypothetical protein